MKFEIQSKILADNIKLAIQFNAYAVHIDEDAVIFSALREIRMPVVYKERNRKYNIKFNTFRWQKVRNFVMDLPDQQVTVDLHADRISIQCDALFVV